MIELNGITRKRILKDYPNALYYGLPENNGAPQNKIDLWLFDKDFKFIDSVDRRKYLTE